MKLVIGITNTRDARLLSSFLDHIQQEEHTIDVMVFCLNLRLKNFLDKRADSRIKEIVVDSELHMICKNNKRIPTEIKLKENNKNFLASADRYISYGYYPFTRVMRKNYTDKSFSEWHSYVERKFNLIQHKLKKFDPNYGLIFSIDNGLAIYNYLYFVFKKLNKHPKVVPFKNDIGMEEKYDPHMKTYFDTDVRDGRYYSEDWTFCENWRDMGGDIFVDTRILLSHQGTYNFNIHNDNELREIYQSSNEDVIKLGDGVEITDVTNPVK